MNKKCLKWVVAAGMMTAFVPSAMAGNVVNGNKANVTLGGYVDRAFLYMNDGDDSRTAVVDNENLSSRFFISGTAPVNERLTAGFLMEVQFRDNSSSDVSIDDANSGAQGGGGAGDRSAGATTFTQRHMDVYFSDAKLGKLSIGQGSAASDGSAETDKSGTGIVAYSGIADMAGSVKFRNAATRTYGPTIGTVSSNMDGLGLDDRIRYDTPTFGGFGLATSYVSGGAGDVGVTFSGKFASVDVAAAVAYWNDSSINASNDGGYAGSLSMKHDSGVSLTLAAGKTLVTATGRKDPKFGYAKLAYTVGLNSLGDTSFGVDYGVYKDVAQDRDEMTTVGVQAVQEITSAGTSLYLGYRNHSLDRTGSSFDDITAVMAGASIAF